jgi:hypothetical protein
MISRIRIDAFGASAADVEHSLFVAYAHFNDALELNAMPGEQVIERDLVEPHGTRHAFKGRMILHPDTQEAAAQRKHVERISPAFTLTDAPAGVTATG